MRVGKGSIVRCDEGGEREHVRGCLRVGRRDTVWRCGKRVQ